ncbi:MAG: barstar family protein [Anaerolineae bacterium]|nr:barstar family protein [Anaerolineae bacterium]
MPSELTTGFHIVADQPDERQLQHLAQDRGWGFSAIDLSDVRNKREVLHLLATRLQFPAYFGANWDALADMLGDLSWLPAQGQVILISGAEGLRDRAPAVLATLLDILRERDQQRQRDSRIKPLLIVMQQKDLEAE